MDKHHQTDNRIIERERELRQSQTAAEATLWRALRKRRLGYKYRRQYPIEHLIIDFYCSKARLCIEIDGGIHQRAEQAEYDKVRTEYLQERGYHIIRFTNQAVRYRVKDVLDAIEKKIAEILSTSSGSGE